MEDVFEILKNLPKPGDYVLLTMAKGSAAGEKAVMSEQKIIWESKEKGFFSEISPLEALGRLFLPKRRSRWQDRLSL